MDDDLDLDELLDRLAALWRAQHPDPEKWLEGLREQARADAADYASGAKEPPPEYAELLEQYREGARARRRQTLGEYLSKDPDGHQMPGDDPDGDALRRIAADVEAYRDGTLELPPWAGDVDRRRRERPGEL
jgi:hypothetical protein